MDSIILEMIERYNVSSKEDYINAFKEVVQEIALYALSDTDFFDYAAFYGGTALRIFYKLDRFSEDLDFSLIEPNENFKIEKYFKKLEETFSSFGLNFVTSKKEKTSESNVQSAFLKGNTIEHMLMIAPTKEFTKHIQKDEIVKIKFEIDINPPKGATYEYKFGLLPSPYKVRIYDESSLFAGKLHALLCRKWQIRPKGRDYYDYLFYITRNATVNYEHLKNRMIDSGNWNIEDYLNLSAIKRLLNDKFNAIDFSEAVKDIKPFIANQKKLDLWSKELFVSTIDYLK